MTYEWEAMTGLSNDCTKVQLDEPISFIWNIKEVIYRDRDDFRAAASLRSPPQHG